MKGDVRESGSIESEYFHRRLPFRRSYLSRVAKAMDKNLLKAIL